MGNKGSKNNLKIFFAILVAICIPAIAGAAYYGYTSISNKLDKSHRNSVSMETSNNVKPNTSIENEVNSNNNVQNNITNNTVTNNVDNNKGTNGTGTNGSGTNGSGTGTGTGNGTGTGTDAGNGTGTGTDAGNGTGTGSGNGNGTSNGGVITGNGTGSGYVVDYGSRNVSIDENYNIREMIINGGLNPDEYTDEDDEDETQPKENINDGWDYSVKDNEYGKITAKMNLLNAPYNNNEYCESKLTENLDYEIKLIDKPEGSTCTNYPEGFTFDSEGKLNVKRHMYSKDVSIDFSATNFSQLGDYYFGVYRSGSTEKLYDIIVTLRGKTTDEGYPTGKTYSMIQIKSAAQNGEKVGSMNFNVSNPNTYITIDKKKNVHSFYEKIYVDVFIASYTNDSFDVLDANAYDDITNSNSGLISTSIGNHYVARDSENYVIPQTYTMAEDGKLYIGRKDLTSVSSVVQVATIDDINGLGAAAEVYDEYEIPVGTKYRVEISTEKKYRENYYISDDEYRVAQEDPDENEVDIHNDNGGNPKTGVFYAVAPFVVVITIAIIGLIIIKKMSTNDDDK